MSNQKHPAEQSQAHTRKNVNPNTRGKNAAGQTQGQNEQDGSDARVSTHKRASSHHEEVNSTAFSTENEPGGLSL